MATSLLAARYASELFTPRHGPATRDQAMARWHHHTVLATMLTSALIITPPPCRWVAKEVCISFLVGLAIAAGAVQGRCISTSLTWHKTSCSSSEVTAINKHDVRNIYPVACSKRRWLKLEIPAPASDS